MALKENILHLRTRLKLSQEEFADRLGISHQSVHKWESGQANPSLEMLVRISRVFHVSADAVLFDSNSRLEEEKTETHNIYPSYESLHSWELYSEDLGVAFEQLIDEGADAADLRELFECVGKLPRSQYKTRLSDILFEMGLNASQMAGFPYNEPSDLPSIQRLRKPYAYSAAKPEKKALRSKIAGAWYGRICGCLLGKPVEGIRSDEMNILLKSSGNYPMHRYIVSKDVTEEMVQTFRFPIGGKCFADTVSCAPSDDDTNYTVLYQQVVEQYGRDFTPKDVSRSWLAYQSKNAYCTAERVAFRNFVAGYDPPDSAVYQNPYREWIGAQIRGDYFGYINPGNPALAAEMAWRDASISHTKNGIYGEMYVAAMIAAAAVCDDMESIIEIGMSEIPASSRLYETIGQLLADYRSGTNVEMAFKGIHARWNEENGHHWCHTISNASIVTAALLYGGNDFGKSICLAVQACFDTDCNGATVGSILGMKNGLSSISPIWLQPVRGKLSTTIFGVGTVSVDQLVDKTLEHIK